MLMYFGAMGALFLVTMALSILGIWAIAHTDTFFCLFREGQGGIFVRGRSLHKIMIAQQGYKCRRETEGKKRWKIEEGEADHRGGFLGLLEVHFSIYWIGPYPFHKRMKYFFKWNEWEQRTDEETGKTILILRHREEYTDFFYVQTFSYALLLSGAETGGKRGDIGGNVSVDMRITLFVRIEYPDVAILHNEDWFEQVEAIVLDHARLYVGSRTFEQLHTSGGKELTNNEFCEYVMELNDSAPIGEKSDGLLTALGVRIVGAVIRTIELSGDSKKIADETTAIYVAEQKAKAMVVAAEGRVKEIKMIGAAEADAIKARTQAIAAFGNTGLYVERQRAIIEAGKAGNTIVFTNDSEHDEKNKMLAGLLVDAKGREIK